MIRGQEPYDSSLSIGSTINESLGMPALNSDTLSAEEAAIQVRDETPFVQQMDSVDRLGQDEGMGYPQDMDMEATDSKERQVPMSMDNAEPVRDMKQTLGQWRGKAQEQFKSKPYGYVLGAVGLGFVLGKMLS